MNKFPEELKLSVYVQGSSAAMKKVVVVTIMDISIQ